MTREKWDLYIHGCYFLKQRVIKIKRKKCGDTKVMCTCLLLLTVDKSTMYSQRSKGETHISVL